MKIPGFIDLQVNGYKMVDFCDPALTEEDFLQACGTVLQSGTAAFLPTLITSPREAYKNTLPMIAKYISSRHFGNGLLGIHLEGPFISPVPGAIGAHPASHASLPSIEYLKQLQDWADGHIKLITIAAELEGAEEFTRYASENGIVVSLGHQMAVEPDIKKVIVAGASCCTHLGNGMPNDVNRHNNPFLAGLAAKELSALIITDGHHLPAYLVELIIRAKGVDKIIVTSDASPMAGMPTGEYHYWNQPVHVEESGRLYNPVGKHLVGSSAMMINCMDFLASLDILTEEELIQVGFGNPLKLIAVDPASIDSEIDVEFNPKTKKFEIIK